MRIDFALPAQIPQLKALWQESFGDSPAFIDSFFTTGYAPSRCRCATVDGKVAAALYWFDVYCREQRMAYIYAVATGTAYRGQGLCRALMADTHAHLALRGYRGALLVPEGKELRRMYAAFGYREGTACREFDCSAGGDIIPMHRISRDSFAQLRRELLPEGAVLQEEENLSYLEQQVMFYKGPGFLAALHQEGDHIFCPELLGKPELAPAILRSLGASYGTFRCPGAGHDFAMFLPLREDAVQPAYFAFAFD